MEIKSITDVITNSSSEVFVIRYKKNEERKNIIEILMGIFESLGLNIYECMDWKTETKERSEDPIGNGIKTRKGDLIITAALDNEGGHRENQIPLAICQFIKNFNTIDKSIKEIQCWFSGIGLK